MYTCICLYGHFSSASQVPNEGWDSAKSGLFRFQKNDAVIGRKRNTKNQKCRNYRSMLSHQLRTPHSVWKSASHTDSHRPPPMSSGILQAMNIGFACTARPSSPMMDLITAASPV